MRKVLPTVLLAGVCLALASAALAARDPRLEKLALRPADMAIAKRVAVQPADVGSGWTSVPADANQETVPDCPGQKIDFSALTITGQAESGFQRQGASIFSRIEVYRARAEALGDFLAGAKLDRNPCTANALAQTLAGHGLTVRVRSSGTLPSPRLGERSTALRVIVALSGNGATATVYLDVFTFLNGRVQGGVFFASVERPLGGELELVRALSARVTAPAA